MLLNCFATCPADDVLCSRLISTRPLQSCEGDLDCTCFYTTFRRRQQKADSPSTHLQALLCLQLQQTASQSRTSASCPAPQRASPSRWQAASGMLVVPAHGIRLQQIKARLSRSQGGQELPKSCCRALASTDSNDSHQVLLGPDGSVQPTAWKSCCLSCA